jgi:transcriptional regulator with XRE-family HTH domain
MPVSYPQIPISIGDNIRKKRMELKLLQKDVAKILGVTEDSITNWEKNRSVPQIHFFPGIINFLGHLPFEIDLTTFSGKIKAYRQINGLSQNKIGEIFKVDGTTVCSWELGENQPHKRMIAKLDSILKIK